MSRIRIKLVPLGDLEQFNDIRFSGDVSTLRELLQRAPAFATTAIDEAILDKTLDDLIISVIQQPSDQPLYRPPGIIFHLGSQPSTREASEPSQPSQAASQSGSHVEESSALVADTDFPIAIPEKDAVRLAYLREIDKAASFLKAGLSVLIVCDKLIVEHLWKDIANRALLIPKKLEVRDEEEGGLMPRGMRQRQLAELKALVKDLKQGDVLVIPHLDLLAGGGDNNLPTESREMIELVYEKSDRLILAFADRSLDIPEVLASRFAVRLLMSGISRTVVYPNGEEKNIGNALVTADEAAHFEGFDPEGLYKNVAGMNPIRLRHAIQYAKQQAGDAVVPVTQLYQAIRAFKVQTSANFEVPNVSFENIGGYEEVKMELARALRLMAGAYNLPNEALRQQLIPRGFIFHGPPGTGKTLFAKAVANQLNATIQVVSGPEVTDMYVGESERKVRELFAEARRNAPAVLVFDEFDSIASKRSGREDGGSRAGNALVAQILTEMDGFRPEVPMLVIGTTNRLDIIDEALLRPSRFKAIGIGLPTLVARTAIAKVQAKQYMIDLSPELLDVIAAATEGMSGDEIQSLFRDACVGQYCENPPLSADAHRFGFLVGQLRQSIEQRATSSTELKRSTTHLDRPGPTGNMVLLTPLSPNSSDEMDQVIVDSQYSPL